MKGIIIKINACFKPEMQNQEGNRTHFYTDERKNKKNQIRKLKILYS